MHGRTLRITVALAFALVAGTARAAATAGSIGFQSGPNPSALNQPITLSFAPSMSQRPGLQAENTYLAWTSADRSVGMWDLDAMQVVQRRTELAPGSPYTLITQDIQTPIAP